LNRGITTDSSLADEAVFRMEMNIRKQNVVLEDLLKSMLGKKKIPLDQFSIKVVPLQAL
jgi:hypothetical protein